MSSNSENAAWSQSEAESLVLWNNFVAHNMMIISRTQKYLFVVGLPPFSCVKKETHRITARMYEMNVPTKRKCADCLNHDIHTKFSWILTYRRIMKTRLDLDVGFGGGWGNNPRGSSRCLLLITASFTGSDTEMDGAGKIGFAVEQNKDSLAFEARDKDSEEALVLSDSANFFLHDLKIWVKDCRLYSYRA